MVKMMPTISSVVSEMSYNEKDNIMLIRFNTGALYEYFNITEEEFRSIAIDEHIGSKLRKVVKEKQYRKIS